MQARLSVVGIDDRSLTAPSGCENTFSLSKEGAAKQVFLAGLATPPNAPLDDVLCT